MSTIRRQAPPRQDASGSRRRFSAIAGHPVLDLVNTVRWRLAAEKRRDDLRSFDDVVAWSAEHALLDDGDADALRRLALARPRAAADEAARVRDLREAVYETLFGQAPPSALEAEYRAAIGASRLQADGDRWRWAPVPELSLPRHLLALKAVDLLTHHVDGRTGRCEDRECGWVFLDTSPRHDRRWCVSADCGNRNRVREFHARARSAVQR